MKLIEAMKKLRLIEKKMQSNSAQISKYASILNTERPAFNDEETQKKEVQALVQSNDDLFADYLRLKKAIERTNLSTVVKLGGKEWTISDLLVIRRRLGSFMIDTLASMNTSSAESSLRASMSHDGKRPQIIRLYDEKSKNDKLNYWQDLVESVDSRLEVVNAVTDIVE